MRTVKVAVAQFQPKDGNKQYNLSVMRKLATEAKAAKADVISFHEMCVTGYTFVKDLSQQEVRNLSESVPDGQSVQHLIGLASDLQITILAGLIECDDEAMFNTYVCVSPTGLVARHRKLHCFISRHMQSGDEYTVFDLNGWKCGILICYDNNVIENVRATALLGAEIIFAPHVTCCTPSSMPGRGYIDPSLWENRAKDPVSLRREFDGPKGKQWLMKWLPARAYDNGVYYIYTNPIGFDGEHLKNGNSMIIDPYGDILTEIRSFDDSLEIAELTKEKIVNSGGMRYRNARRPELYKSIVGSSHEGDTSPAWLKN